MPQRDLSAADALPFMGRGVHDSVPTRLTKLPDHGLGLDAVFHSHHGVAAIGIAATGRKFVYASPERSELYDVEAIFEARASKLPQGDFMIGISVPGRVTGLPYWQELIVTRRRDAVRWVETLKPCLGARLKVDGLG